MALFGETKEEKEKRRRENIRKRRAALTPSRIRRIKEVVEYRCEIKRCNNRAYEVHHIKDIADGGRNMTSNLVVLCANCHRDATDRKILPTHLRDLVKNRDTEMKQSIRAILFDRNRVEEKPSRMVEIKKKIKKIKIT